MSCFSMVLVPGGVSVVELNGMGLWSEAVHQVCWVWSFLEGTPVQVKVSWGLCWSWGSLVDLQSDHGWLLLVLAWRCLGEALL